VPDWLLKLIVYPIVFVGGLLVLRYVLGLIVRALGRGGRVALAALSSGGLSLLSGSLEADLEPALETRPTTKRALLLNALASGGVSLLYTDPPTGKGDAGTGSRPAPQSGSSGGTSAPPEALV
jgi:hypothetical protein